MVGMFGWEGFDVRNASLPDEVFCLVREIGQMVADEARGEEEGGGTRDRTLSQPQLVSALRK